MWCHGPKWSPPWWTETSKTKSSNQSFLLYLAPLLGIFSQQGEKLWIHMYFFWAGADSQGKIVTGYEEGEDGSDIAVFELALLPRRWATKDRTSGLCSRVCLCVYWCICAHVCRSQRLTLGLVSQALFIMFFETKFIITWSLLNWLSWLASEPPKFPISTFAALELQVYVTIGDF